MACGVCNNDAVLWKREEKVGFDHKMLWLKGKNQAEKWLVFARFFSPFLKMHREKWFCSIHKFLMLNNFCYDIINLKCVMM